MGVTAQPYVHDIDLGQSELNDEQGRKSNSRIRVGGPFGRGPPIFYGGTIHDGLKWARELAEQF